MTTCTTSCHICCWPLSSACVVRSVEECLQGAGLRRFSWRLGCGLQTACWQEGSCLWGGWGRRWRSKRSWRPGWSRLRWARLSLCSSETLELSGWLKQHKTQRNNHIFYKTCPNIHCHCKIPHKDAAIIDALCVSHSIFSFDSLFFLFLRKITLHNCYCQAEIFPAQQLSCLKAENDSAIKK